VTIWAVFIQTLTKLEDRKVKINGNKVTLAISQIGMRNSPRNFESAVIRGFTGVVEINGRDYVLIGVVVGAYRRSSYSIDRIFLFDKERLIC